MPVDARFLKLHGVLPGKYRVDTLFTMLKPKLIAAFAVLLLAGCQEKTIVFHHEAEAVEDAEGKMVLPAEVSFNEHIQPILSEYCYHCHGPDAGTRMPEKEPIAPGSGRRGVFNA